MFSTGATLSRAAFGPVMLITLGALFAYEYTGGPAFFRTWPVMIIVAGLWKLADYLSSRAASGNQGLGGGQV